MASPAYTVYGTAKSRAARVLWMLEELGQPYEHIPVGSLAVAIWSVGR